MLILQKLPRSVAPRAACADGSLVLIDVLDAAVLEHLGAHGGDGQGGDLARRLVHAQGHAKGFGGSAERAVALLEVGPAVAVYIGGFSKSFSLALRVSYLVLPWALLERFWDRPTFVPSSVSTLSSLLWQFG